MLGRAVPRAACAVRRAHPADGLAALATLADQAFLRAALGRAAAAHASAIAATARVGRVAVAGAALTELDARLAHTQAADLAAAPRDVLACAGAALAGARTPGAGGSADRPGTPLAQSGRRDDRTPAREESQDGAAGGCGEGAHESIKALGFHGRCPHRACQVGRLQLPPVRAVSSKDRRRSRRPLERGRPSGQARPRTHPGSPTRSAGEDGDALPPDTRS